ncbi:hypothetical protein V1318_18405 [Lysobacter sp. CCNWLW3]|uniref:hypothetical protein n=1 Tax=unclassified Lysobacter TaxID=2635362 RepID=UPI002FCF8367
MSKYRFLLLVCLALTAVVAAYLFGRKDGAAGPGVSMAGARAAEFAGPAPGSELPIVAKAAIDFDRGASMPPLGTPLKNVYARLQAQANAGDGRAAARLLRDLNRCSRLRATEWSTMRAAADLTEHKTENLNAAQLRTYQTLLESAEIRQRELQEERTMCEGVGDEILDTLNANLAQAARLGDADARACYLSRGPLYDQRGLLKQPGALGAYRREAATLIETGLAAGDWRVVDLLQSAYEPGAQSLLAGLVGADVYHHYRYLKLYRLGAENFRTPQLDRQLALVATNLSPAQRTQADEWAQTTLRENFNGDSTAGTPQGWDACAAFGG